MQMVRSESVPATAGLPISPVRCNVQPTTGETLTPPGPLVLFFSYNAIKTRKSERESTPVLSAASHMLAAAEAGVCTLTITNPIWVAKTRLCLQYDKYTKGIFCVISLDFRKEPWKNNIGTVWTGLKLLVSICELPGSVGILGRPVHANLKTGGHKNEQKILKISSCALEQDFCQQLCGELMQANYVVFAGNVQYRGLFDCLAKIYKFEGIRGWYKVSIFSFNVGQFFDSHFAAVSFVHLFVPLHRVLYQVCSGYRMVLFSS